LDASQLDGSEAAEGLRVTFNRTNPGPNAQTSEFVASGDNANTTIRTDLENGSVFVLWNTEDVRLETQNRATYNATFSVIAPNNSVTDENESASTQFVVEEADVTLNQGEDVTVPQGEATISGETNLASGTELVVRARSPEPRPLLETQPVTVGENGTFDATFDF